ncbi:MAG: DHA2 family efflux MFS transporter permease subunit [Myxococcaceae bacterium]|nr:DHA2 family efflux MFS transporter permease subunit [Myxococcaceae bacterium]
MSLTSVKGAPPDKWLVTLSVSCGTLMASIDASIINVALPQIRGAVGATLQEVTWASTGFIIASVLVLPLTGLVGRLFGQKRAYLVCLALFTGSSFLCGLAWNLPSLVCFRVLQGLSSAVLTPTEQAILRRTFPPEEQGMAMAVFSMVIVAGPAVGPTLGGFIVDNLHWSWIFFINLPVGALGLLMVWRFVEEPPELLAAERAAAERQRRNMDWSGIALLSVGLASLQYMLEEGQSRDWFDSPAISACALVASLCLPAFVLRSLRAPAPAVELRLFRDPVFTSGALLGAVIFFVLVAGLFLLSLFMQEVLGFTATHAGLALMPRTLAMMVTMPIVGRLYGRLPSRWLIATGVLLTGLGVYLMSRFSLDTAMQDIVGSIILQGLGTSLIFVPLNTVALDHVPRSRLADAAGVIGLLRQVGSSLGLAFFVSALTRYTAQAREALGAHLTADRPEPLAWLGQVRGGFLARGLDEASAHEASLRLLAGTTLRQATILAFDRLFLLAALLLLGVLPLLLFLRTSPRSGPRGRAHLDVEA